MISTKETVAAQLKHYPQTIFLNWREFMLIVQDRCVSDEEHALEVARINELAQQCPNAMPYITKARGWLGIRYGTQLHDYFANFPPPKNGGF